jgi:putative endonuclease
MRPSVKKRGEIGEDIATEYLKKKGYHILERNWRGDKKLKCPEIDIIAEKNNIIVFVEVKTSSTGVFGEPEHWITPQKQKRLAIGASAYLVRYSQAKIECRFDAITVDLQLCPPHINHIKNAFLMPDEDMD